MFEESVCLLLRASWFNPLVVEERGEVKDEIEDYYEEEEEDLDQVYSGSSSGLCICNRRWGENGCVRTGRQDPIHWRNVQDGCAGPSRQPKKKQTTAKDIVDRRAKRALKQEAADKAAAESISSF